MILLFNFNIEEISFFHFTYLNTCIFICKSVSSVALLGGCLRPIQFEVLLPHAYMYQFNRASSVFSFILILNFNIIDLF
jgi:hypothetical protein